LPGGICIGKYVLKFSNSPRCFISFFLYIKKNIRIKRGKVDSEGRLGGENLKKEEKKISRKESEEMKWLKITNGVDFLSFLK